MFSEELLSPGNATDAGMMKKNLYLEKKNPNLLSLMSPMLTFVLNYIKLEMSLYRLNTELIQLVSTYYYYVIPLWSE